MRNDHLSVQSMDSAVQIINLVKYLKAMHFNPRNAGCLLQNGKTKMREFNKSGFIGV